MISDKMLSKTGRRNFTRTDLNAWHIGESVLGVDRTLPCSRAGVQSETSAQRVGEMEAETEGVKFKVLKGFYCTKAQEFPKFPHGKLKMWLAPRPVLQPERTKKQDMKYREC